MTTLKSRKTKGASAYLLWAILEIMHEDNNKKVDSYKCLCYGDHNILTFHTKETKIDMITCIIEPQNVS